MLPGSRQYSLTVNGATQTHLTNGSVDSPASFSLTYVTKEGHEKSYTIHSDPALDTFESRRLNKSGGLFSRTRFSYRDRGDDEYQAGKVSHEERAALMDLVRRHVGPDSLPLPSDSPGGNPEYLPILRDAAARQRVPFLQWLHGTPSQDRLLPDFIRELRTHKKTIRLGEGRDPASLPDLFADREDEFSTPTSMRWNTEGTLPSRLKYGLSLSSHSRRHLTTQAEDALVDVHLHLEHPDGRRQWYRVSSNPRFDALHFEHAPSQEESLLPNERSLVLGLLSHHTELKSLALPRTTPLGQKKDEFQTAANRERTRAAQWLNGQLRV